MSERARPGTVWDEPKLGSIKPPYLHSFHLTRLGNGEFHVVANMIVDGRTSEKIVYTLDRGMVSANSLEVFTTAIEEAAKGELVKVLRKRADSLVDDGLIDADGKITDAGRAALAS